MTGVHGREVGRGEERVLTLCSASASLTRRSIERPSTWAATKQRMMDDAWDGLGGSRVSGVRARHGRRGRDRVGAEAGGSSYGDEGGRWQRSVGFGTSRHVSVAWVCAALLQRILIPVTYRSLRVWRQLLHCPRRSCASVVTWAPPSSHVYRVPWAVTVFWCGLAAAGFLCYVMLCYE